MRKKITKIGNIWDIFKHSNIWIKGMPEEEEEKEIENIMKENFLNLVKEIDFQEVQEAQRVPKNVGPKEEHTKAHHNYISQD